MREKPGFEVSKLEELWVVRRLIRWVNGCT